MFLLMVDNYRPSSCMNPFCDLLGLAMLSSPSESDFGKAFIQLCATTGLYGRTMNISVAYIGSAADLVSA